MAVVVILTILTTGISFSQEKTSQITTSVKQKSENLATVFSLVGTVVPLSLFIARVMGDPLTGWMLIGGSIIGPSFGYFYGGLSRRGFRGIGVRSLCLVSLIGGVAVGWNGDSEIVAHSLIIGGIAGYFISAIYDIASVSRKVREHNAEIRNMAFSIAPIIVPQKKMLGIGVHVQFCYQ
ncbi:MAG: hypothetical protein MUP98_13525 [Candidatus Aminicenantes bacterium]|nr:hypothetical protein [Candidatus Aminicenantes bacterium]